ncbi:DUF1479 domain-containing protein [Flexivirga sp. ID2601S]|uniref:DUF1479 domain-containing protein n=1 Tax=Flexivirga aerilata TaxID=1656889 RepID=A0A849ANI6_9MICO|nr:DUF1479 domain-containing protein [Flexivirga aerilata]NNG39900.1 DUF1479 domain-containing protein [Flexivirga aerilata]
MTSTTSQPALPHWEEPPADLAGAVRHVKHALRRRIEASGRTPEEVFEVIERTVAARIAELREVQARGESPWPVLEFDQIADGKDLDALRDLVRRRGCAVIRGHFPREQALAWDAQIVDYVERNEFFEHYRGPGDDFFDSVDSAPEIYPVYWSYPQMEARQSDRMATVQGFLNSVWKHDSEGRTWFDPDRDSLYPDRIRRRPPGADSAGLGTHLDPGTLDLWMTQSYQQAFRHLFDGDVELYDPWDAAHRTDGAQYPGSTMCSAFRTFQGWTALSDMAHDQGVLHTVPIPEAMAYLMLRPLLDDVPSDEMCGVGIGRAFPVNWKWHPLLMEATCGLPDIQAGDSVWWHCDLVHGVDSVVDQQGWGNVMYIPAAPWCPKNERYAVSVREAFRSGDSPADFPAEHYERDWAGRFTEAELNRTGRRGMGLE